MGPLSESDRGNCYIMVVGDYFSRWMEAIFICNQEASPVAEKLVDKVFLCFSAPEQLHSDQGRKFESQVLVKCISFYMRIKLEQPLTILKVMNLLSVFFDHLC